MPSPVAISHSTPLRRHALAEMIARAGLPADWARGGARIVYGREDGAAIALADKGLFERRDRWRAEAKRVLARVNEAESPQALGTALFVRETGGFSTPHDLPAVVHGLLHRWEEDLDAARDEHGRWPLGASLLKEGRLVERPAADWICRAFGWAVRQAFHLEAPEPARWNGKPWAVALTFDIDSAGMYAHGAWPRTLRRLQVQRGLGAALPYAAEVPLVLAGRRRDPHDNLDAVADRLESLGACATFFAQAVRVSGHDTYALDRAPGLVRALRRLNDRGHEIGLHGSYATADEGPRFLARQRRILLRHTGIAATAHRAHYLRTTTPRDAALWSRAGIRLDATPGFAEREGFRLGTAFPVMVPRAETGTGQSLVSVPLHAMDVTLRYHRQLAPAEAWRAALNVLRETRRVGGLAVLLWHPHNLDARLWRGWEEMPFELLRWALEHDAATGTLTDLAKAGLAEASRRINKNS
ncbi:MAG: hypothetical protein PWP23_2353 [Candidatus Sumerlaeota bacterium]|nr:hypothetical protein [Candidatus Sumerlaeota bacterium]